MATEKTALFLKDQDGFCTGPAVFHCLKPVLWIAAPLMPRQRRFLTSASSCG
jgi:hypothetical protein